MTTDPTKPLIWRAAAVMATAALAATVMAGSAAAQSAAADQGPVEVFTTPGSTPAQGPAQVLPRAEHDWHPFSSNSVRVFMVDVQTIVVENGVSRVSIAKLPLQGAAGDYSHAIEVVELRCATQESRSTTEIQFGRDGAETERYDDATAWEAYRPESRDGYLANLVCGNERSANNTPSLKAWVDAGRKVG